MKLVNLVLACFITYMACLPCSDAFGAGIPNSETAKINSSPVDNHPETNDLCTPLCICSCCGGFSQVVPMAPVLQEIDHNFFSSPILSIHQERRLQVYASIWQPPKV